MIQATHNIPPKRLSKDLKKHIALEALSSHNISETARQNGVTRKTAYKQKNKALESIDKIFENDAAESEKVLFHIPVTKTYLKMIITLLFVFVKASVRDTCLFLQYAFDFNISPATVINILDDATASAKTANESYEFSACKNSSTDEMFHQTNPVLAAIDLDSKFCMLLKNEENRDSDTWGCHLLDLMGKGYNPDNNIMDGGSGMIKAFDDVLTNVTIRYDHFHITQTAKDTARFLKNKMKSALTDAIKASEKMDKAKKQGKHQKESVNLHSTTESMEETEYVYQQFKTLTDWLQYDILQFQSFHYNDRSDLFDFIVEELKTLGEKHPHRINAFVTTLENQKEKLLSAAMELNDKFKTIAKTNHTSLKIVWEICNLTRFSIYGDKYYEKSLDLNLKLGDLYDKIEDEVLAAINAVHRTSSMIENLNSRIRPLP